MFDTLYLLNEKHHLRAVIETKEALDKHNDPLRTSKWVSLGPSLWMFFVGKQVMFIGTRAGLEHGLGVDITAKLKRRKQ